MRYFLLLVTLLLLSCYGQVAVTPNSFGFQCGLAKANCPQITWPAVVVPNAYRAWDVAIAWGDVMKGWDGKTGTYNWANVDSWMEQWGAHGVTVVWYTSGWVPNIPGVAGGDCTQTPRGCSGPPSDLTASGSPSFTQFTKDIFAHCETTGHHYCFSQFVKYWAIWNESGSSFYWGGTTAQLYQMASPVVKWIRANYPNVIISSPELSNAGDFTTWMNGWTALEVANGTLSDVYTIHTYLTGLPPEQRLDHITAMSCMNTGIGTCKPTPGWKKLPMWLTEVNYSTPAPYSCSLGATDCAGIPARFQILAQQNYGFLGVYWYAYMMSVGSIPLSEDAYTNTMKLMTGGTFSSTPCVNVGTVWTCSNFIGADGSVKMWVWTTSEAGTTFTVPSGFTDYKDLHGGTTVIQTNQPVINITVEPILLENAAPPSGLHAKVS